MKHIAAMAVVLTLTVAGCAELPPIPRVDAAPAQTLSGAPVMSGFGVPVTGRNWNCPSCYR